VFNPPQYLEGKSYRSIKLENAKYATSAEHRNNSDSKPRYSILCTIGPTEGGTYFKAFHLSLSVSVSVIKGFKCRSVRGKGMAPRKEKNSTSAKVTESSRTPRTSWNTGSVSLLFVYE
jgi:hypothetical protein